MKQRTCTIGLFLVLLFGSAHWAGAQSLSSRIAGEALRQRLNFDAGWRFHQGEAEGAFRPAYDDQAWRAIELPHDWSIEGAFSEEYASGNAYLPGGTGWYRKSFTLPEDTRDKHVSIQFDGVYQNSEVWINGHRLGKRPYGYISFQYDLTPYLHYGDSTNVLAVKATHTPVADSRWYTGSGIYRHVWLKITNPVRVKHWGTHVTTPEVSEEAAEVRIRTKVVNSTDAPRDITLGSAIHDPRGKEVGQSQVHASLQPGDTRLFDQRITVANPERWSLETPSMYKAVSRVEAGGQATDRYETPFGIRTFRFDDDRGFFLNGEPTLIKGVCLHHDAGPLGAAVPDAVWAYRLRMMKEMGANAIRTSHNPASPQLLAMADSMGFVVMEEAFDEWARGKKKWIQGRNVGQDEGRAGEGTYYATHGYSDFFEEWAQRDIQAMVRRDRNHPSIVLWSLGNEIDYPNDPYADSTESHYESWRPDYNELPGIAENLYDYVHAVDTTRPITAAVANPRVANKIGYAQLLDVVGYNYSGAERYEKDHRAYPERKMIGSENGDSYDAWRAVKEKDYVAGQFLWTGIDYLGEAGRFPNRSNDAGLVDLSTFKKPGYYFRKSLWTEEPMVHLAVEVPEEERSGRWSPVKSHWNWGEHEGETLRVEAYTNCDRVRLFLNGELLGSRAMSAADEGVLRWRVPYRRGTLRAVGVRDGQEVARHVLQTAGAPDRIVLKSKSETLHADGADVAHVKAYVVDEQGRVVPRANPEVTFEVTGPGESIAVGSGNHNDTTPYSTNRREAYEGTALALVQAGEEPGTIRVRAEADGLQSGELVVRTE